MKETNDPEVNGDELMDSLDHRMVEIARSGNVAQRQKRIDDAQRARQITSAAFRQENIHLTDEIPNERLSELIIALTAEKQSRVDYSNDFINKRIADCLISLMPREVKKCWKAYPEAMLKSPGFYYHASEEYGQGLWSWVYPDMPQYFEQGTETDILCKNFLYDLCAIDKTVVRKKYHEKKLAEAQVKYADQLIKMHDQTYYSLLKEHPLWFEIVYNSIYPEQKLKYND